MDSVNGKSVNMWCEKTLRVLMFRFVGQTTSKTKINERVDNLAQQIYSRHRLEWYSVLSVLVERLSRQTYTD